MARKGLNPDVIESKQKSTTMNFGCNRILRATIDTTLWSKIEEVTDKIAIQSFTVPRARE